MRYSKKNLCPFGFSGDGEIHDSPVFNVLRAVKRFCARFSGNLTASHQVVFRTKNLKRFSDIKLSSDDGLKPFLYAVRTVFVGFVTFFDRLFAARECLWPG
jgi:hypothetical protein